MDLMRAISLVIIAMSVAPCFAETPTDHLIRGFALAKQKYPEEAAADFTQFSDLKA